MFRIIFAPLTILLLCANIATAAVPTFSDPGDGTIVDTANQLVWLKNANCFGRQAWAVAISKSSELTSGQCGLIDNSVLGDWHLPTLAELRIFTDSGLRSNTLNGAVFSNVQTVDRLDPSSTSCYWSSTILHSGTICVLSNIWNFNVSNVLSADLFWV